jgi:hypothetical protein
LERRAFQLLHLVLGLGLLATGADTLVHALRDGQVPLAGAAAIVVAGSILFLIPRTLRLGGIALLVVVLAALVQGAIHSRARLDFAVFAAGIWFVMEHGAAWGRTTPSARVAA